MADAFRVVIDLDREAEPIAGELRAGAAEPQRFAGLLELMALIDACRDVMGGADAKGTRDEAH
jgi:hypothetical protein